MDHLAVPARVAGLGEYFALRSADGPGWHGYDALLQPDTLRALVSATRVALARFARTDPGRVPLRAAASTLQLGMAARLVSPLIGSVAALQHAPVLTPESLRWKTAGHSVRFAVTDIDWHRTRDAAESAAFIDRTLLDGILTPLVEQFGGAVPLSPKVMWGNVISAANGAVTVLGVADSALVPAGRDVVRALADTGPTRGTAVAKGATFVRRSCCLYYQVPRGGLCGDCVLRAPGPAQ